MAKNNLKPLDRKNLRGIIVEVLADIKGYAGKDHYIESVIEEKEPFFWRIRPRWAKEKADEIISKLKCLNEEELLIDDFKRGYNKCLKDQKLTGEKWQHLYL